MASHNSTQLVRGQKRTLEEDMEEASFKEAKANLELFRLLVKKGNIRATTMFLDLMAKKLLK